MAEDKAVKWFVVRTRAKQEKSVKQQVESVGVETFLPTRVEIRNWHDRKKKVETVLIPNTLFIRAEKQQALNLHNEQGIQISFVRDMSGSAPNTLMVVPDVQMEAFMKFIEVSGKQYDVVRDAMFVKGDRVIVTQGPFKGIIGELVRIDGNNKVLVKLEQLVACSLDVEMGDIERLDE